MKFAGLLLLLSVAGAAGAQPVYKCTRADGSNSYQSIPCAEDEDSTTRAQASTVSGQAPVSAPMSAGSLAMGQRRVQVRYRTDDANFACDSAKAQRTAALGAAGAQATAEMRGSLDRDVQNACK